MNVGHLDSSSWLHVDYTCIRLWLHFCTLHSAAPQPQAQPHLLKRRGGGGLLMGCPVS